MLPIPKVWTLLADYAAMSRTPSSDTADTQPSDPAEHKNLADEPGSVKVQNPTPPREIGGRDGPEPTRFGDWEKGGRCIDF